MDNFFVFKYRIIMDWSKIDLFGVYLQGFLTATWILIKAGWPFILFIIALKILVRYFEKKYPKKKER